MAPKEFYQEGQKTEGGFWRFLAFAVSAAVILALVIDSIDFQIPKLEAA